MSFAPVTLEQFADATLLGGAAPGDIDPQTAYLEGFAAGEAEALQRLSEAERAFIDAATSLDSALKALRPSSERALAEALETLFAALLPALTERGFASEAAGAVARAFAGDREAKLTIVAHPTQAAALAESLAKLPNAPGLEIAPDESVAAASARVVCGRGGLEFDLGAAAEACLAALTAATGALKNGNQS